MAPRPFLCFPVEKKAPGGQLGEVGSSGAFPDTEGTAMTTLTTTPDLLFTTWNDPAVTTGIAADSDDALVTGRDAIFVPCECMLSGAR